MSEADKTMIHIIFVLKIKNACHSLEHHTRAKSPLNQNGKFLILLNIPVFIIND